eukprot:gene7021-8161_t
MSKQIIVLTSVLFVICAIVALSVGLTSLQQSVQKYDSYSSAECTVEKNSIDSSCYSDACGDYNDQIWWYNSWGPSYFFIYVKDKMAAAAAPGSDLVGSFSSDSCGGYQCMQGVTLVTYIDENGQNITASILGLWSDEEAWVQNYLLNYDENQTYTCYYQRASPENVMWFAPPKFNKTALVVVIVFGSLGLVCLMSAVISAIKLSCGHKKEHHVAPVVHKPAKKTAAKKHTAAPKNQHRQSAPAAPPHIDYIVYQGAAPNTAFGNQIQQPPMYYQYNHGVPYIPQPYAPQPYAPQQQQQQQETVHLLSNIDE